MATRETRNDHTGNPQEPTRIDITPWLPTASVHLKAVFGWADEVPGDELADLLFDSVAEANAQLTKE
jgi:hypothetical protein